MPTVLLPNATRWLAAVHKDIRAAAHRGLVAAAQRTVQHIQTEVIPKTEPFEPVDRGAYRAAWRAEMTNEGAIVTNTLPYADPIEHGIRPGFHIGRKMIDALADWAYRKGFGIVSGKGPRAKKIPQGSKMYRDIAWAIAKATQKRGRKGLKVLERALPQIPKYIEEETARELRRLSERV